MRRAHVCAAVGAAVVVAALVSTAPVDAFYEAGIASIYGPGDSGGQYGPTGQRINHSAFAAAHKTLPLGTLVEVVNKRTGRSAVVKITDRGPYVRGRIIDLTPKSAAALGVDGLDPVRIGVVPDHGCTFSERYGAASMAGQLLAHGRSGCPLASGEVSKDEDRTKFKSVPMSSNTPAPEKRRRASRQDRRDRTASRGQHWPSS
jgi:rare lipoprotein A